MTRIVIAEDHQIVREGVISLLEEISNYSVVGQAGEGRRALEVVEREEPDLLVVDLSMPELNGLEVIRRVHRRFPEMGIVVLSIHDEAGYVARALQAGARGYLVKEDTTVHLVEAVERVTGGGEFFSPDIRSRVEKLKAEGRNGPTDLVDELTDREREILQLVAEGYTSKEIADRLYISPRTADTHRANVMEKLDLDGITELIRYAIRKGVIGLD